MRRLSLTALPIIAILVAAALSPKPIPFKWPKGVTTSIHAITPRFETAAQAGTASQLLSGSAAFTFTPANLSGLALYMDPNNASSLTLSGSDVLTWTDLSSNADVFTGKGLSGNPTKHTNVLNGKTCIQFVQKAGFDDSASPVDILGDGTHPFTIWFVTKNVTFPFSTFAFVFEGMSATVGAGKGPQIMYAHSSQTGYTDLFWGGDGGGPFKVARATTAFSTPATAYVGSVTYDGTGTLAGTQWYSANSAQTTATGTDNGQTSAFNIIGNQSGIGFYSLNGDLCHLVIQRATLSATDRSNMETYYTAQFGSISP